MEDQITGLLERYWRTLADIGGSTFSIQFDKRDPEYTLHRGYLESRSQLIQLLADDRPNLSNARMVRKRFCEQAGEVTRSVIERWPAGIKCPFQGISAEEIA